MKLVITFIFLCFPLLFIVQKQQKQTKLCVTFLHNLENPSTDFQELSFALLDKFQLDDWETAGFTTNTPILKSIRFSIHILQNTSLPFKMKHFCDEDFICLNFNQTLNRAAEDLLNAYNNPIFALLHPLNNAHEIENFTRLLDRTVLRFERFWYRQDVTNNLEFCKFWARWFTS